MGYFSRFAQVWRAGKIERMRERLVVLTIRREVLLSLTRATKEPLTLFTWERAHERFCETVQEIGLLRYRLRRLGVEMTDE